MIDNQVSQNYNSLYHAMFLLDRLYLNLYNWHHSVGTAEIHQNDNLFFLYYNDKCLKTDYHPSYIYYRIPKQWQNIVFYNSESGLYIFK